MKCFTTWLVMITLTGCTTLRPIDVVRPDFSQLIASGELKIRDHVTIETTDGQADEFDCRRGCPHDRVGQRLEGWGCGGSSRQ